MVSRSIYGYQTEVSSRTDLSARVGWLNPAWNQSVDSQIIDVGVVQSYYHNMILSDFPVTMIGPICKSITMTGEEFLGRLDYYANAWLPARDWSFPLWPTEIKLILAGKFTL